MSLCYQKMALTWILNYLSAGGGEQELLVCVSLFLADFEVGRRWFKSKAFLISTISP